MKIYVLHYTKLVERKQNILKQFEKHGITDYEFITLYDKDELTEIDRSLFVNNLSPRKISLLLKHIYTYKQIANFYEHALILEDDAILSDDFSSRLKMYVEQIPIDYDMVFLGDGCKFHIQSDLLNPEKFIYKKEAVKECATRCTDSYIISNKCAKTLIGYFSNHVSKIIWPIDFWLNDAARDNNLNVYWAEPTIVTQGSENGTYVSSLL
jgi:GR25 family glycosyltransferase involved in LPS biosynthesis